MGIKLGLVGAGAFAQAFIPLFKAHPLVDEMTLCDLDTEKLKENATKHDITSTSSSLDHLLNTDVDAVVIITQNWLHAPQAIQALKAGKHVYSAVPTGVTQDEISELVKTVEETGQIYMIGETSYYYPGVVYCRQQHEQGAFGHIVYAEGEYYHDWDHGLYDVMKWRGGDQWMAFAGSPPMYYPTHSTSQIISITGAYMTHVSCQGFVDHHEDGIYKPEVNRWHNKFSNEAALFKMSDGSSCRINEFRRIGHPGTVRMTMFGTEGSFEDNKAGAIWVNKQADASERLDELLACRARPAESATTQTGDMDKVTASDGTHLGVAAVHDTARLPREFMGLHNGHSGSHQFLVDDFVKSCYHTTLPPNNVWMAARYAIPGIIAHDSACQDGILLEVPDYGAPPE